jgi:hypothetical protein
MMTIDESGIGSSAIYNELTSRRRARHLLRPTHSMISYGDNQCRRGVRRAGAWGVLATRPANRLAVKVQGLAGRAP